MRYTGPGLNLTIDGQIDDTHADMLVDTGAELSMLTSAATARRALQLHASDGLMMGIGGASRVYTAWIKEFRAGPTVTKNEQLGVINDFGAAPSFDAILGAPFLLQTDLEISLATKEIRFFRRSRTNARPSTTSRCTTAAWARQCPPTCPSGRASAGRRPDAPPGIALQCRLSPF